MKSLSLYVANCENDEELIWFVEEILEHMKAHRKDVCNIYIPGNKRPDPNDPSAHFETYEHSELDPNPFDTQEGIIRAIMHLPKEDDFGGVDDPAEKAFMYNDFHGFPSKEDE